MSTPHDSPSDPAGDARPGDASAAPSSSGGSDRAARPRRRSRVTASRHFPFAFEARMRAPALAFGITPNTTGVAVTHTHLVVRFGPWRLATPLANIEGAELSGPYRLWK